MGGVVPRGPERARDCCGHDGGAADMFAVVNHYNSVFQLGLRYKQRLTSSNIRKHCRAFVSQRLDVAGLVPATSFFISASSPG